MYVKELQLINFRNYKNLLISFKMGLNVLIGNNAQGKTNILESIYYCSLARSHRTNRDKELVNLKSDNAYISAHISKERLDKIINIKIFKQGKKGINVNSIKINKISSLIGIFNVVMFSPEDLDIIKGSPSERRKLLDIEICKLDKKYYYYLSQYKKVLSERNALLKNINCNDKVLDIYDVQLSSFGSYIIKKRLEYIKMLNKYGYNIHFNMSNEKEKIEFIYKSYIKNIEKVHIEKSLYNALKEHRNGDVLKKNTSVGPHRDDFCININDIDIKDYGSQGQQRTSVLTIKFASLEIIKNITGEYPVLLLDDVLSELDTTRQKYILNSIRDIQTIITCTGASDIGEFLKENSLVYEVENGFVKRIK